MIMRIRCLFLIQPLRKAKAAVRHVVFGMVWTSPKQARQKSRQTRRIRLCNMMETDCSTYLTRVRARSPMTQFEQTEAWSRQRDQLRQVLHNLGSRVQYEDSHGSSQAASSFPCPATVHRPTS